MEEQESVTIMRERKLKMLAQKHEEMKLRLEQRKEQKTKTTSEEENINNILTKFESAEQAILCSLKQIENANVPKDSLPELFDSCYWKLEELQKLITLSSHVLKIYHKKQFQEKYRELNDKRMKLEQSLMPEKKFRLVKLRSLLCMERVKFFV